MKKRMLLAFLVAGFAASAFGSTNSPTDQSFRQVYQLDAEKTAQNVARLNSDLKKLPAAWQNAPAVYYAVPALSDVPRLPDSFPDDGVVCGPLRAIAAQGEYEPVSIVIAPRKNVDKFTLTCSQLYCNGKSIPATEVDIKVVKTWYQAGSGWYGYFADALGRVLTPELLLNDENMVRVDPATKDNYVRYENKDGSVSYEWMTANFMVTNYSFDNQAVTGLIADSPTLKPVVLNTNEFKQYMITVHVPKGTPGGVYRGEVYLQAEGKTIGKAPLAIRVLPFELPAPKANYDRSKGFYLCLYGTNTHNEDILKNIAAHNALTPMGFPYLDVFRPENFHRDIELAEKVGISTGPIFAGADGVGLVVSRNPQGDQLRKLERMTEIIRKTADLCKKELGHTNFYSYGVDEGGPSTIRGERSAWQAAHEAGGKVMVSSYAWRELLYALDYMVQPGAPAPRRIKEVNLFHESNPASLCGWYANPHSGPENPDYFRRIHGYQCYKSNYDLSSNYCWYRNNWNDMATPYEENLRGIIMIYAGRDKTFDTIAWEGVREGMDDVRYASYLKDLALEAAASKDGKIQLRGRRVLSFLAYTDEERVSLDAFRIECINYILELRDLLGKGK